MTRGTVSPKEVLSKQRKPQKDLESWFFIPRLSPLLQCDTHNACLPWQITKPFGIFSLTQLFMWATGLSHLVALNLSRKRAPSNLLCDSDNYVTCIYSTSPPPLQSPPTFPCHAVKLRQIWFVEPAVVRGMMVLLFLVAAVAANPLPLLPAHRPACPLHSSAICQPHSRLRVAFCVCHLDCNVALPRPKLILEHHFLVDLNPGRLWWNYLQHFGI